APECDLGGRERLGELLGGHPLQEGVGACREAVQLLGTLGVDAALRQPAVEDECAGDETQRKPMKASILHVDLQPEALIGLRRPAPQLAWMLSTGGKRVVRAGREEAASVPSGPAAIGCTGGTFTCNLLVTRRCT